VLKRLIRWFGIIIGVLLGLVLVLVGFVYISTNSRMDKVYSIGVAPLSADIGKADIKRGEHIVAAMGACRDCHGDNLAGQVMLDDPALGRLVSANLTAGAGGIANDFSDIDWVRAIRHGVGKDGKSLLLMPAGGYNALNDDDLASVIAYFKTLPAVDNQLPEAQVGPLARALTVAGVFPLFSAEAIDHSAPRPDVVPSGPTAAYGGYITTVGGCADCHGARLAGGSVPGADASVPPGPNLTQGGELIGWSSEDFRRAMREGVTPAGRQITTAMPWQQMGQMSDEELEAVWQYLKTLPPRKFGENE
jgi:mono/diheme cytochrome c family protein